jgi:hypothetical protein
MRRFLHVFSLLVVFLPGNVSSVSSMSAFQAGQTSPFRDVEDRGGDLPSNAEMEKLAQTDPIAFLENCLRRYDREVKSYRVTLQKQERLGGTLQGTEVIEACFREEPFSVRMDWVKGTGLAQRTLYVKGQYDDQLQVLPAGLLGLAGVVSRDPKGAEARSSSRYPITEFGIKVGMQRTLAAFEHARKEKALHVDYLGKKKIKEAGDRLCWVLRRSRYKKPEVDGITGLTLYIDTENWLQVGSTLKGADNKLIGEYFFRDLELNPKFADDTFTREGLKR